MLPKAPNILIFFQVTKTLSLELNEHANSLQLAKVNKCWVYTPIHIE